MQPVIDHYREDADGSYTRVALKQSVEFGSGTNACAGPLNAQGLHCGRNQHLLRVEHGAGLEKCQRGRDIYYHRVVFTIGTRFREHLLEMNFSKRLATDDVLGLHGLSVAAENVNTLMSLNHALCQ